MLRHSITTKCLEIIPTFIVFFLTYLFIWVIFSNSVYKTKVVPSKTDSVQLPLAGSENSPGDEGNNIEDLKSKLEHEIQEKFQKQLDIQSQETEKLRTELQEQLQEKDKLQKELEAQLRENDELKQQLKPVDKLQADYDAVYKYYPLKPESVQHAVAKLQQGEQPEVEPLSNEYNVTIVTYPTQRCTRPLGILIVIKTCPQNKGRRDGLRQTWANLTYLSQFDVPIEYTFVLGRSSIDDDTFNQNFLRELETTGDFILADFVDHYRNNTHKVIAGLRWAVEHCKNFEHLIMVDDDMYVSIHNVLRFLRGERDYPKIGTSDSPGNFGFLLDGNSNFWGGHNQWYSPAIHQRGNQWAVTYEEYPFPFYPPVLLGMMNVYSRNVAEMLFLASPYVKPLSIDDAYLTIVGLKLDLNPFPINAYLFFYTGEDRNSTRGITAIGIHGIGSDIEFWQDHDV